MAGCTAGNECVHYCYTWRCTANIKESNFCACWRQEEILKKRVGRIRVKTRWLSLRVKETPVLDALNHRQDLSPYFLEPLLQGLLFGLLISIQASTPTKSRGWGRSLYCSFPRRPSLSTQASFLLLPLHRFQHRKSRVSHQ